jgi:hypothetical protein
MCVYTLNLSLLLVQINNIHLTINWGMYVCVSVCLSVCMSVCSSVCPAIRFHSSQRIFSKFGGNLLRVMTRGVGYILCVRTQRARACVHAKRSRMCAFAYFWTDYVQFDGNILRLTISGTDYILFIVTHRVYVCKRASAIAGVITHSLIYGRIIFKFAVNITSHIK